MKDLAIIGAGGFGKEVKTLVDHINQEKRYWNLLGFYDDKPLKQVQGLPILGTIEELVNQEQKPNLVVGIGNSQTRCGIASRLIIAGAKFVTLVHPSVIIGDEARVQIAAGSIVTAGVVLTTDIEIGAQVIINLNTTVGHDVSIGNFCSIMPGVNLAGHVKLNEGAFIGAGANVLGGATLGEFCKVGAGAVVMGNIPAKATAVGVPARVVKRD